MPRFRTLLFPLAALLGGCVGDLPTFDSVPNPAAKAAEAEPSADELANYAKKRRKLGDPLLRQIRRSERSFGLYFGHFA